MALMVRSLIIDNYDSYTFNLYQLVAQVNREPPIVIRNDELPWREVQRLPFDNIILSPGPGRPESARDFGVCGEAILAAEVPLLGVCLGHQGIGHLMGGAVTHAPQVWHGRQSRIYHDESALFRGLPQGFLAVRYHSLIVAPDLPAGLEKTAWTEDGLIMGLRHRQRPLWGVQFHPESICTEHGQALLDNFRQITEQHRRASGPGGRPRLSAAPAVATGAARAGEQGWSSEFCVRSRRLYDLYPDAEQAFVHLYGAAESAFWLDSAQRSGAPFIDSSQAEQGLSRFSFLGDASGPNSLQVRHRVHERASLFTGPDGVTTCESGSLLHHLRRELERRACSAAELPFDFNCGFVGYLGYELKAECGAPPEGRHRSSAPDAHLILADRVIAVDHQERAVYLVCLLRRDQQGAAAAAEAWFATTEHRLRALPPLPPIVALSGDRPLLHLARSQAQYLDDIAACLSEIHDGQSYEICLTNRISTTAQVDPLAYYRALRRRSPAPYSAFLRLGPLSVACSSPERFLKIDRDGQVEARPIKGTRPRGQTEAEDRALREALRSSVKDRAENLMIVDLLRNDLGRVCEIGSVHVPHLMEVATYATLHQLVSTVRGRLRPGVHPTDCIRAAFPGGSMTGAPKLRTMEIIDRLETQARGIYSGAIGYLGLCRGADLNIVIRTAVCTPSGMSIGAGGAITALSDPHEEFAEMQLKAKALLEALAGS